MITLNFRKSTEELPPFGKPILVISGDNPAHGYCYDCFEEWMVEAYSGYTDDTYPHNIPLDKLPQKDLMVSLNENFDISIKRLKDIRFLWILKEEYEPLEEFFNK